MTGIFECSRMQSFGSYTSIDGDDQQGRRLTRIELIRQSTERDMRAFPHLYPIPSTPFFFTAHVAHLLGITLEEVVEIPASRLSRHTRADGEQVFVAEDVMEFIRGNTLAKNSSEQAEQRSENALLTPEEVATELRVSTHQVRKLANTGDLPFINVGNGKANPQMRFEPESVAKFKARRRVSGCPFTSAPAGKPTRMTFNAEALDIQAIRDKRRSEKQKK